AGWLAGLSFGTSGYAVYFMLEARGYGMLLAASAALVWFHARWAKRPTWRRAVPYVLAQIVVLYTHFSGLVIIALTGIHVLLAVPYRSWWKWGVVMLATGVAFLPLLRQFLDAYHLRLRAIHQGNLPSYLLKGPESLYRAYSVHHDAWWAAILLLAGIGLTVTLWRKPRRSTGAVSWLSAWGIGIPVFAYLTRTTTGQFTTRYLSYTIPAVMLLTGLGLGALPGRWQAGGTLLLLVAATFPWQPFDHRPRYSDAPPVRDFMREMVKRFQTGDVLVVDPSIDDQGYDWWYYEPLYFPGGRIPRAQNGRGGQPRVWYLVRQGSEDPGIRRSVESGRYATQFWGPWYFIVTLYEGPPLTPGVRVGDVLRFRGQTIPSGSRYLPGDTLAVHTWWSADAPPPLDYSIGLHVVDSKGHLVLQSDSGPQGPLVLPQTSAWEPGQVYRDDRAIKIPWCMPTGFYDVRLTMYQSWDGVRLIPEGSPESGSEDELELGRIQVDSFAYCNR
ncbi:MAG TPA: hypothetical protein VMT24_06695, partial [Aggregatilineaceae bacterium]|nr:hypothetical protein [Aggregatilineaceae bacterium]